MKHKIRQAFTLFEVMIALAILSIAMIAGVVTTNSVLEKTVYIEKKILAHWFAMNTINKLELGMLKEKLEISKSNGDGQLRGIKFKWDLNITKAKFGKQDLLNIQVSVSEAEKNSNRILDTVTRMYPMK